MAKQLISLRGVLARGVIAKQSGQASVRGRQIVTGFGKTDHNVTSVFSDG